MGERKASVRDKGLAHWGKEKKRKCQENLRI